LALRGSTRLARRHSYEQSVSNPRLGADELVAIEIPNGFSAAKWAAEYGHAHLPFDFSNYGQSLDVCKVPGIAFDVLPKGAQFPAVEFVQLAQHSYRSMFFDQSLDFRKKVLVILFGQFSAHSYRQDNSIRVFVEIEHETPSPHCVFVALPPPSHLFE
jgi:hypothetical protein